MYKGETDNEIKKSERNHIGGPDYNHHTFINSSRNNDYNSLRAKWTNIKNTTGKR